MRPVRLPGSRRHKYNATAVVLDGIRFASVKEAKRFSELLLLVKAGEIENVQVQPAYVVTMGDTAICTYKADFRYQVRATRAWVIEDVKSPPTRTPIYKLKKKLVEAQYGIRIQEI